MGVVGVDKADMLCSIYGVNRKSVKWWQRLFWGILDIAFINSYVVYKSQHGQLPLLEFRQNVVRGLLMLAKAIKPKRGRPSAVVVVATPQVLTKCRKANFSIPLDIICQTLAVIGRNLLKDLVRCEVCF